MSPVPEPSNRLMLLLNPSTYRAEAFLEAAGRLGLEVVKGLDRDAERAGGWKGAGERSSACERLQRILGSSDFGLRISDLGTGATGDLSISRAPASEIRNPKSEIRNYAERSLLVERFIPGKEVALEGLLTGGE